MLLRPPPIHEEDVKSQSSNHHSPSQRQKSVRSTSKNKKKQTTIGIGKKVIQNHEKQDKLQLNSQNQFDNQSVKSVNSRKSKGKTKESTIALKKKEQTVQQNWQKRKQSKQNQIFKFDSEDDNKSANSHASKNSKKNKVKENSLGKNKFDIQMNYYKIAQNDTDQQIKYSENSEMSSFKDYSKVQKIQLDEQKFEQSPKVIKYTQQNKKVQNNLAKNIQKRGQKNINSYSPFQEITLNRQEQDQDPIFVLKQVQTKNYQKQKVSTKNILQAPFIQSKKKQILQGENQFKLHQQQPGNMLDTKSLAKTRRNKIFQNGNNSKSNFDSFELNSSQNFQKSRSKSKSKLGGLLKQSRQKKCNQSKVQNSSHLYSNSIIKGDSKINNGNQQLPKIEEYRNSREKAQIQPIRNQQIKVNNNFDLGASQYDLNLSNSVQRKELLNLHQKSKDSVYFNFQKQRQRNNHKKGLSITSKDKNKQTLYSQIQGSLQLKKETHMERLKKKKLQSQNILNSILISSQIKEENQVKNIRQNKSHLNRNKGIQLSSQQQNRQLFKKLDISNDIQQNYFIKQVQRAQIKNIQKLKPQLFQQFEQPEPKINQITRRQNKQKSSQIILQRLPTIQTQQISETRSQKSTSQQKKHQKRIKQNSLNKQKKHSVQVRNQSPRGEESFYQSDKQQIKQTKQNLNQVKQAQNIIFHKDNNQKQKIQNKKPMKLLNFESQQQIDNFKSKTDSNFYQYCQQSQKSLKPPSSKPPLSRKSNASSSNSKSKPKQTTIKINKQNSLKINLNQKDQTIKKSLVEIAQQKNYELSNNSRSDSQQSFYSKQSLNSGKSKSSKKSLKKESTLPITIKCKNSTFTSGLEKPPLKKNYVSSNQQIQIFDKKNTSIYEKLSFSRSQKQQRDKILRTQNDNKRKIISKDTYFIDQRTGRLMQRDLVIQGNMAYSIPNQQSQAQKMVYERMRKSRQRHRSRSKQRSTSQSKLSKKVSNSSSYDQSGYQSNYSNTAFSQSNQVNSNSYYNQNMESNNQISYGSRYNASPNTLQQFLRPIEQKPVYKLQRNNNRKIQSQFYQNQDKYQEDQSYVQKTTLNQLFGRKKTEQIQNGRKKSLQRTQKRK